MTKPVSNKKQTFEGVISVTSKGVGYIAVEGFEDDIEIPPGFLLTALYGDTVEVRITSKVKGERASGEITRIIKRAKEEMVGVVDKRGSVCYVIPDDRRMYVDIFIPEGEARNLKNGYKVLVGLKAWDDPKKNPEGVVRKVFGPRGENEAEMAAIVVANGFSLEFPSEVLEEAERIKKESVAREAEEILKRRDFRSVPTFTIDPADAKDFDDALSLQITPAGIEVGVHIADSSHYVREGSLLDKEAQHRGTSVYLIDRVVPMLPEILSNDLCSLNAHENKLTFSAVFTFNKHGEIVDKWFGKTVIRSAHRFTYESAQKVLDDGAGPMVAELLELNRLAKHLRPRRFLRGAISFEREEYKFELDEHKKIKRAVLREHTDSHFLVEEFMLLANVEVAGFMNKVGLTAGAPENVSLYRIHDHPKVEKLEELYIFLKSFGHDLKIKDKKVTSKDINALFEQIKGKAEEGVIKSITLATMAKAIYSTKNIGHFGLASEHYTHFTSPIRRYPDTLAHRFLVKYLSGEGVAESSRERYEKMAVEASERETRAVSAERASIKFKQAEYMKPRVGEIFSGVITGVTEWGIYVEEEGIHAEGMVRLRDLKDDFYVLDRARYRLVGENKKRVYALGQKVRVRLAGVDLDRKSIDFVII